VDGGSEYDKVYYFSPSASRLLIGLGTWNNCASPCPEPRDLGGLKLVEL
jgi:hypothetical protein